MTPINRRRWLKACGGALAGLMLTPLSFGQSGAVQRQLRFSLALSNPHATELRDQILWLYLPATENPIQKLDGLKVSMDYALLSDALGHNILKLSLPSLAPLATKVVTIAADVLLDNVAASTQLPHPEEWLTAERYIETADARIQALAAQLKRAATLDTALAIYDWVRQQLHYAGYIADDLGALTALLQRSGDCTEYAYLAVALARANGIPARMVGGYVADRNIAPRAEEYHNWAELYVDGAWRLLDAQKENWLAPVQQYIAFRFYRDQVINPVGLAHRFNVSGDMQVRL